MSLRRTLAVAAVATLTATGVGASAGTAGAAPTSPLATYIVTLAPGFLPAQAAGQAAARLGGRVEHVYDAALTGYAVRLPATAAARLHTLAGVQAVEADREIALQATEIPASWGLDRIDQRTTLAGDPSNNSFSYTNTGSGVTAYVIDTGIQSAHVDFGGRAVSGYDAVDVGTAAEDCNGHGTHVAGTIGGKTYGVAKQVGLVAVRVLDCKGSGRTSDVLAGINWVTDHHRRTGGPAVANMSLGGGISTALDGAVTASIGAGVTYAVAAGNGNSRGVPQDACASSPARVDAALTVGATDRTDNPASFSNYGSCVDLFAPGVGITSDWYSRRSTTATDTISGTSMAAPHVAGVAALFLQTATDTSPAAVATAISGLTTKDAVHTTRSANNDLLFTDL